MESIQHKTKQLAVLGMLLAIIAVLSWLEHMLPPLPALPPNIRLGLSNVVTMYALFFLGRGPAFTLTVLKSLFVLLTRGATAGLMSLCGGLFSITVILLLSLLRGGRISYLLLSVAGAIAHNIGQIVIASFLLGVNLVLYYLPVLILFGVLMGSVTGMLLRVVLPLFEKTFSKGYGGRLR